MPCTIVFYLDVSVNTQHLEKLQFQPLHLSRLPVLQLVLEGGEVRD